MLQHRTRARLDPTGRQIVTVTVRNGYRPQSIPARAGLPLRLIFDRQDEEPCSERVVFSSPRLERRLAPNGATVIDLPAQPPGEIRFTCGMGRYRGRIELVDERDGAGLGPLHLQASAGSPDATAVVLWLITLPLVALPASALLDVGPAVVAGLVSLVAWLIACRLVFSQSRSRA